VHGAPACVTLNVWPAIVAEPVRCEVDVLAATVTVALPLPVPLAPAVIESQLVALLVPHVQPLPAVTATVTASPAAGDVRDAGEIEYVQGEVVPACVTSKVWPAIVTEPVRCEVDVLAATATVALPSPVPLAPAVIESQLVELSAVHAQLLPAVTTTVTASPAAGDVRAVGEIV
jgi:hypothetical protein